MRWKLVEWLTIQATELSGKVLKDRAWPYQLEDYQKMKQHTLGWHYNNLLENKVISYKANLVKHDMKHLILGYDMSIENELNIVAFLLGNKSANKLSIVYLIICLLIVPEYTKKLKKHYIRGKNTLRIKDFDLASFATLELPIIHQKINLK